MSSSKTTAKKIRSRLLFYTAAATILTGLIISLLTVTTLYKQLKLEQVNELSYAGHSTTMLVNQYLDRIKDVSRQIASRTQAHLLVEKYQNKQISFQQMNGPLKRILNAALISTENLSGITRISQNQTVLAAVGTPIQQIYWPNMRAKNLTIFGPFKENSKYYLTVATPIYNSDKEYIASDIGLFDISNLETIIKSQHNLSENARVILGHRDENTIELMFTQGLQNKTDVKEALSRAINLQQAGTMITSMGNSQVLIAYSPIANSHWAIATIVKSSELFAKIRKQVIKLTIAIILLVIITTLIAILLLKPLAGSLLLHASELEKHIEEKTEELKKANATLKYLACVDSLTRLINKRELERVLKMEMNKAQRHNRKLAILFVDLDDFKDVNDKHGHFIGDKLLESLSERMVKALRAEDVIARVGGDEFTVLLTDPKTEKNIRQVAKKLLDTVKEPYVINNLKVSVTLSIGVAIYPKDANDVNQLLARADTAMYLAKSKGKNTFAFHGENK